MSTQGSRFYVKQLYHDAKTVWSSLELIIIIVIFLIGLFLGYVLGRWTFFGLGSSLKAFFWVYQFCLIRTSPSLIYLSTPPGVVGVYFA